MNSYQPHGKNPPSAVWVVVVMVLGVVATFVTWGVAYGWW